MKIKLNTGQVVEERLNRAQRLIRLGKAIVYIESETYRGETILNSKQAEAINAELIYDGIEEISEISIKPKFKVKVKKVKKLKKAKKSENKAAEEQEYISKKISSWRDY